MQHIEKMSTTYLEVLIFVDIALTNYFSFSVDVVPFFVFCEDSSKTINIEIKYMLILRRTQFFAMCIDEVLV